MLPVYPMAVSVYIYQTKIQSTIDNLIANHQNITVNNQIINIRRLVNPAKKLILSNVCPTIPNSITESSLNYASFT